MGKIKIVSSDLNGTLVHEHTMSDMIRCFIGQSQYLQAKKVFDRQTSGEATISEAFNVAGPLTRGLSLRDAVEYAEKQMHYVKGFREFLNGLEERKIPFVINSTGYSVTIYTMRALIRGQKIHGQIGNSLKFGLCGDKKETLTEDELEKAVRDCLENPKDPFYLEVRATGEIELGIANESDKSRLILDYTAKNFPDIKRDEIMHMGDSIGDSRGIIDIARAGGVGVAFNYNGALNDFLVEEAVRSPISGKVCLIDPKGKDSDLTKILDLL